MWKWIVGILLVIVLLVAGTCYRMYRKVLGEGDTAQVMVHAPAEHVFAALADVDSMVAWVGPGVTAGPTGRGALKAGDSLTISQVTGASPADTGAAAQAAFPMTSATWVVREVSAPWRLVMDRIAFNSGTGQAYVAQTWRDSVVVVGDSTKVMITVSIPPEALPSRAGGDSSGQLQVVDRLTIAIARGEAEHRLNRLKTYFAKPQP